jgi:hypothetical protein
VSFDAPLGRQIVELHVWAVGQGLRGVPFLVARILQDGDTDIFATGRYFDLYKLEDGEAKLNERTVVCDSSRIDTQRWP